MKNYKLFQAAIEHHSLTPILYMFSIMYCKGKKELQKKKNPKFYSVVLSYQFHLNIL